MKYYRPQDCLELDQITQSQFGISSETLMENAGKSCTQAILKQIKPPKKTTFTVLCGPGNNGGDGRVISRELAKQKFVVRTLSVREGDFSKFDQELGSSPGWVIDALFGVGARFPFSQFWQKVFERVMARAEKVVSIDHPSGFPTTDGAECTDPHIRANWTLSIGLPKFSHYTHAGPEACGKIIMCDAGFPAEAVAKIKHFATGIDLNLVRSWLKAPSLHAHKNQLGHVGFLAGSAPMPGALTLCVQGALHAEAGKVTVFGFDSDFQVFQRVLPPEVMYGALGKQPNTKTENLGELLRSKRVGALVIGPGLQLSRDVFIQCLQEATAGNIPLIFDAEVFRNITQAQYEKAQPSNSRVAWIGHLGEQQVFFGVSSPQEMFLASLDHYQQWLKKFPENVWLRKGLGSVVVSRSGRYLNTTGNVGLAKGGSGDLLAGIIGALSLRLPLDQAVASGVWIHGRSADLLAKKSGSPSSVTPSACVAELPKIFSEIYSTNSRSKEKVNVKK